MPPVKTAKAKAPAAEPETSGPESQLSRYLDQTKTEHFNYVEDTHYTVSTGSLNLDAEIGGFGPSLVRLVGPPSSGKSSFALNVAREFIATVPGSRVMYIKCEGRLSADIQGRSGLTYVKDPAQWRDGTVFVFECNVYEVIIGLLRDLITSNPDKHHYMFILDSMDGLNLRDDMSKTVNQANRVAGAPLLTKQLLQKIGVAMTKYGHLCFFLGQVSSEIKLDPYAKVQPRQVAGAGGNAIQHYASTVLSFQEWYESDLILENPEARVDRLKNRPLGHTAKVRISKADKEKRHITVEIPIKHGVVNGSAIWREREIADQLLSFGLVTKGGSWLTLTDVLREELATKVGGEAVPEKVQGLNQLYTLLESWPDVTTYLFSRFKEMISGLSTTPASAST